MSRFIEIDDNPVPDGAEAMEFSAPDGARLRGGFFPVDNARATVVLMTGWPEFIEKYFEVIEDLRARKFNVAMMDWRGQGLSDRKSAPKIKWRKFFHLLMSDLRHFMELHVKARFNGPYILMTHSMGGMSALLLLASGYPAFERAVLCAPMTRLLREPHNKITDFISGLAVIFGAAAIPVIRKRDHAEHFEGNIFTSDPVRHARFRQLLHTAPEAANKAPTYGWVNAAIKASYSIHRPHALDGIKTPTLIITAGKERQIDGTDHAVIAAANPNIRLKTVPGSLHEIMMEQDEMRTAYFDAFDEFVEPIFQP
ncbi:alpha/beta hydrolase [Hyphococcus flavus]|uniref:Alpha/beta hydrolase n=1 Tax=Hyphococcus flavus TaxID=1866326 RepID=A0AAF0CFB4_9PROT|nr:alpha/beta hydrolase [Hyphococcus flavus]WDI32336.1 alpha/beta hydrolase [Hyphococcus flavus]